MSSLKNFFVECTVKMSIRVFETWSIPAIKIMGQPLIAFFNEKREELVETPRFGLPIRARPQDGGHTLRFYFA
jgi:hypothetical protein